MPAYAQVLQRTLEALYDDERLRANLVDAEAKVVLDWASAWLTEQVNAAKNETAAQKIAQTELARVKSIVSAINTLAAKPGAPALGDALNALGLKPQPPLTRAQTWRVLGLVTSAVWQANKKGPGA
jgi:hypothetical protein